MLCASQGVELSAHRFAHAKQSQLNLHKVLFSELVAEQRSVVLRFIGEWSPLGVPAVSNLHIFGLSFLIGSRCALALVKNNLLTLAVCFAQILSSARLTLLETVILHTQNVLARDAVSPLAG